MFLSRLIFLWRFLLHRIPLRPILVNGGLEVDYVLFPVCHNSMEDLLHLFFSCFVAQEIWRMDGLWIQESISYFWESFGVA